MKTSKIAIFVFSVVIACVVQADTLKKSSKTVENSENFSTPTIMQQILKYQHTGPGGEWAALVLAEESEYRFEMAHAKTQHPLEVAKMMALGKTPPANGKKQYS